MPSILGRYEVSDLVYQFRETFDHPVVVGMLLQNRRAIRHRKSADGARGALQGMSEG